MAVVGGSATLVGPVIGAVVIGGLPFVLSESGSAQTILFAGILFIVILLMPSGIHGGLLLLRDRIFRPKNGGT
jgi:ABC-type branched-subunit amino acid transport system permease subunit